MKEYKAKNRNIYFTAEMNEIIEMKKIATSKSAGQIVRDALDCLVARDTDTSAAPVSVFSDPKFASVLDDMKHLTSRMENLGSTPKRRKILQDVEDIQKGN